MDQIYLELIRSDKVLPKTREVLVQRLEETPGTRPKTISLDLYPILQAVIERLIPQTDRANPIDIAALLDEQHVLGKGNGWRYADMPRDKDALEHGLRLLERDAHRRYLRGFAEIGSDRQDLILTKVQSGDVQWGALNAKHWFEEVLTDATALFVSHPETLAEIGFSGIAIRPGWVRIGLNEGEEWEPQAY